MLDPDPYPDPHLINADPQPCLGLGYGFKNLKKIYSLRQSYLPLGEGGVEGGGSLGVLQGLPGLPQHQVAGGPVPVEGHALRTEICTCTRGCVSGNRAGK